jgi:hypothetical protein
MLKHALVVTVLAGAAALVLTGCGGYGEAHNYNAPAPGSNSEMLPGSYPPRADRTTPPSRPCLQVRTEGRARARDRRRQR